MFWARLLLFACAYASFIVAESTTDDGLLVLVGGASEDSTGTTPISTATSTVGSRSVSDGSSIANETTTGITSTEPSPPLLMLTGSASASATINSLNQTGPSTSRAPQPTNTTPCNLYVELCSRGYSNITQVCAHNSPFVKANNAAANQAFDVTTQLDDGIRMLQIQAHVVNGTVFLCHSSCDILNAGTMTEYLSKVTDWVSAHPYDVVSILIGNAGYNPVDTYTASIADSGLLPFVYIPHKIDMTLDDWPLLSTMIIAGSRVVIFMDYETDQNTVPYILDEFRYFWETPFDPTDRTFPCTVQRPPNLPPADAKARMYIANHNLNTEISLLGESLLVPTVPLLETTNNVSGPGSLGLAATQCDLMWGKPPTVLNVDYYNVGNGSVFEVAAKWNNVTYDAECCGLLSSAAGRTELSLVWVAVVAVVASMLM